MIPAINTKRLRLRSYQMSDLERHWQIGASDFEVVRWLTGTSWPPVQSELVETFNKVLMSPDGESCVPMQLS
ncbi:GNAT family N-acetyltransferase [Flexibacterium corallicola]|uniref:hypothetical protein n=1 Tax=Flexibacterium corallicola TaxID=3037259 RepID=UPI00286FA388|nr:hypothetical protein [Pseudovibrio sp. M1P-2-3]